MKNNSLLAFLGGVAVGAVLALLLAPDSGENTRRKIKASLSDLNATEEETLLLQSDVVSDETVK